MRTLLPTVQSGHSALPVVDRARFMGTCARRADRAITAWFAVPLALAGAAVEVVPSSAHMSRSPFQRNLDLMTPRHTIDLMITGRNAVGIQAERLLEHARRYAEGGMDSSVGRPLKEVDIDARFMVVALHHLWLALKWKEEERSRWWPKAEADAFDQIVGRFRRDVTADSTARDVVMHFDDYARGRGGPKAGGVQGTRTAYFGASLTASPNDPSFYEATITIQVANVTSSGGQTVPQQRFDARAIDGWVDANVAPLIERLVKAERRYTYNADGTIDFDGRP